MGFSLLHPTSQLNLTASMTSPETPHDMLASHFADFLTSRSVVSSADNTRLYALAKTLAEQQAAGHSCIELDPADANLLLASGLASNNALTPLIVESQRLYLRRYWQYESRLAMQLATLAAIQFDILDPEPALARHFPTDRQESDAQQQAARAALTQALTVVTGGPGTGKTTTVLKILALLLELNPNPPFIALAAPTGKAAMRLQQTIVANKAHLNCPETIKQAIPESTCTLHRLLGAQPPSPYFRHNADFPLPYDVVVVDETSMVDLALMSKLVDALKPGARLILLGDKDQLASVEAGAVLADIARGLPEQTVELRHSHRFQGQIKALAEAVHRGDAEQAWQLLLTGDDAIHRLKHDPISYIGERYRRYFELIAAGAGLNEIFTEFQRFQVLCANQQGPYGAEDINRRVERATAQTWPQSIGHTWYLGRPVMISRNHAATQLYNGDIGICLPDSADGQPRVYFPDRDGFRGLRPARLPACETVYAMTIHKSQGSEFDEAMLVLPERVNPVLSRELLYTGITRAKRRVSVFAERDIFETCVAHPSVRHSGLGEKLIATGSQA